MIIMVMIMIIIIIAITHIFPPGEPFIMIIRVMIIMIIMVMIIMIMIIIIIAITHIFPPGEPVIRRSGFDAAFKVDIVALIE